MAKREHRKNRKNYPWLTRWQLNERKKPDDRRCSRCGWRGKAAEAVDRRCPRCGSGFI